MNEDETMTPDEWKADQAFQVWAALCQAMVDRPELANNAYFVAICSEVNSDFQDAFARCS